jgi:5-methylcytosine-specific restriction protein A
MCRGAGRIEAATIVDHVTPHKGDRRLFWDKSNWQSLCKPCHDRDKQSLERVEANAVKHDEDGYRDGW